MHHKSWSNIVIKESGESALCCVPLGPSSPYFLSFARRLPPQFIPPLSLISHGHTETSSVRRRRRILGGLFKDPKMPTTFSGRCGHFSGLVN